MTAATMPSASPRAVLVTGAARRLGRTIALAFARDGWDVALHYRDSEACAQATAREIESLGQRCVLVQGDLATDASARQVFNAAATALPHLTALINNASAFRFDAAATVTEADLLAHLLPNLVAPVMLAQALHRHVLAQQTPAAAGVVINLLDQKLWNLNPDFFSYTLSKAALSTATTLLAQAFAPALRVVGVAPGLTLPSYLQSDAAFARTHALAPLGRASDPDDVARTVLFAATSRSITGTTLIVDGGQHLMGLAQDFSLLADPSLADPTSHRDAS